MEDIKHILKTNSVELSLPTKNKGKFRWKNRSDNSKYGEGFATTTIPFTDDSYIEWQIGYDAEVDHEKKTTILSNIEFIGANGKRKNPYELSEILYLIKQVGLIDNNSLKEIYKRMKDGDFSFDEFYQIETSVKETVNIADFIFHRQDIILPTFSDYDNDKGLSIEISIQKQQYASGVQPMVYFIIPIYCFENHRELIGKTSREVNEAVWNINSNNYNFIIKLFEYFGICSWKHKHDVLAIINELIKY